MPSMNETMVEIPPNLLESFLPGFNIIRRYASAFFGFDISVLVSLCFIIGAFIGAFDYVWRYFYRYIAKWFNSSVEIRSADRLHEQVMDWISAHVVTEDSRFLTARSCNIRSNGQEVRVRSNASARFTDIDATIPPVYAPAFGKHWFWHKGHFFIFERSPQKITIESLRSNDSSGNGDQEIMRLTCFGRSADPIKKLLTECKQSYANSCRTMTLIRRAAPNGGGNWTRASSRPSRPMDTIYIDSSVKSKLLDDAKDFLSATAPRFYARRGIPYRRGYLLHGPPGTGKTSVSFALAGVLGLELYTLSLSDPLMSDSTLAALFSNLPSRCIVLMEDVDAAGLNRKEDEPANAPAAGTTAEDIATLKKSVAMLERKRGISTAASPGASNSVTLSGLLNAIDGVASQEGRLLIMTTNEPETLDQALIRPGRVDMQVYFGPVSRDNVREIFRRMYETDPDPEEGLDASAQSSEKDGSDADLLEMATRFADAIPELAFTPAEVQRFLLTKRSSPQQALEEVQGWREKLLAAKAAGKNVISSPAGIDGHSS